jgi:hypothetical protein
MAKQARADVVCPEVDIKSCDEFLPVESVKRQGDIR